MTKSDLLLLHSNIMQLENTKYQGQPNMKEYFRGEMLYKYTRNKGVYESIQNLG